MMWMTAANRVAFHEGIIVWQLVCVFENEVRELTTYVWYCDN